MLDIGFPLIRHVAQHQVKCTRACMNYLVCNC